MSHEFSPHLSRKKCPACGLVNAGADETCRRCSALLFGADPDEPFTDDGPFNDEPFVDEPVKKRSLLKRLVWILGTTLIVLLVVYVSLRVSSEALLPAQQTQVEAAISVLQQGGFTREVFVLKHLVTFRRTDHWWNRWVGHRQAYAATNFPFEIVTLYPEFFDHPVDDKERAAVLLHEAYHLMGSGEDAALEATWRNKQQFGWTAERYKNTRVWNATEQLTRPRFPLMFTCGSDNKSDCF